MVSLEVWPGVEPDMPEKVLGSVPDDRSAWFNAQDLVEVVESGGRLGNDPFREATPFSVFVARLKAVRGSSKSIQYAGEPGLRASG